VELTDIAWIMTTASLSAQVQSNRHRADRAEAAADDHHIASSIHAGTARGFAAAAAELRGRLCGAHAEIERLRDTVEDLLDERKALLEQRSAILTASADLMLELDELKARAH
jgi:chromosome segregation ATPase